MTSDALSCAEARTRIEAYVAGEMATTLEDRMAKHLMACPGCAADAGLAQRVAAELSALPAFDAPPQLISRIKAAARDETPESAPLAGRRLQWALWPAALAATLVAALAVGWWPGGGSPAGPTSAQIVQAEREARQALALVARIGRKARAELLDEVLIDRVAIPVLDGVGRSLNGIGPKSTDEDAPERGTTS